MAEHALMAFAVEDEQRVLVGRQLVDHLLELRVRDIHRARDVARIELAAGRARVDDLHAIRLGQHSVTGNKGVIDELGVPAFFGLDGGSICRLSDRKLSQRGGEKGGNEARSRKQTDGFHDELLSSVRVTVNPKKQRKSGGQLQLAGESPSLAPRAANAFKSSSSSSSGTSANFSAALFCALMLAR